MPYSVKEKIEINLKAQRALGKQDKASASDRRIFMQQCMADLQDSGEADDEDDARDICELLWEESGGDDL